MKLLSKSESQAKVKREHDELVEKNIRLRQFWREITERLNTVKDSYESDKLVKLREFENFCKDLLVKKEKLLQELMSVEQAVKEKKELFYGLVERQDALDEKIHEMTKQEERLKLREAFVVDLETKWREKQ